MKKFLLGSCLSLLLAGLGLGMNALTYAQAPAAPATAAAPGRASFADTELKAGAARRRPRRI